MTNQLYENHELLKNMMKKYLGDIVDSEEFEYLFVDDPNVIYRVENLYCTWNLTRIIHLHKCIILVPKYPNMNDYLENYLQKYNVVDEVDGSGWTALHYACNLNLNQITKRTVEILINSNANVNLQNNYGETPLHFIIYYKDDRRRNYYYSIDFTRILILAGADIFNARNIYGHPAIDYFSPSLIKHFEIDLKTKTIGIIFGKLTKPAKK